MHATSPLMVGNNILTICMWSRIFNVHSGQMLVVPVTSRFKIYHCYTVQIEWIMHKYGIY